MPISDRLDQIAREAVEADEQWDRGRSAFNANHHAPPIDAALANGERTLAALRAVLDLCGLIEKAHEANPERTYEQGMEVAAHKMRAVIAATLGEDTP